MSRYENRKTISLTRFDFVSLRCKDISTVEGKSESAIIEEVLMRRRPPLMPESKELGDILLRYYIDSDACTKMMKAYFDFLSTKKGEIDYVAAYEMVMILHRQLCDSGTSQKNNVSSMHKWIAKHLKLLLETGNNQIDVTEWQMQFDSVLENDMRYEGIVRLILRDWATLRSNATIYTVLSLVCECVTISCIAGVRYQIAELFY